MSGPKQTSLLSAARAQKNWQMAQKRSRQKVASGFPAAGWKNCHLFGNFLGKQSIDRAGNCNVNTQPCEGHKNEEERKQTLLATTAIVRH